MAKPKKPGGKSKTKPARSTDDHRHEAGRPNNSEAGLHSFDRPPAQRPSYGYDADNDRESGLRRKVMGIHYTPPPLAAFVAERLARDTSAPAGRAMRILDPACGEGTLLAAFMAALRGAEKPDPCVLVGVEADEHAAAAARTALECQPRVRSVVVQGDFLDLACRRRGPSDLFETRARDATLDAAFDVVIANPPYVRTQHLGAERSQRLAACFGLSGRVDLYHAFLVAATESLRPGGHLGVITSNRFLTTLGGRAVRRYLAEHYEIDEIIDLGDTKIFEAAVLPAIFLGRRRASDPRERVGRAPRFLKIYTEADRPALDHASVSRRADIFDVLRRGRPGSYRIRGGTFRFARGDLVLGPDPSQVWSLTTGEESGWLRQVCARARGVFGDVATVRVGIKTTADDVFIRDDWEDASPGERPERALLRPLLTHEDACRWALPAGTTPVKRVLYPHELAYGRRRVVELARYPRARAYLESHRERLEERRYVTEAGRLWYEIWVPQDPGAWSAPKLVFPDISPGPRFHVDCGGSIVNGDCYWMTLRPGIPADTMYLLLAVANSNLMSRFHDLAFNNRLYAGRRRYITQYVAKYPLPDPASPVARDMIAAARRIVDRIRLYPAGLDVSRDDAELDALVDEAFGQRSPPMML
ncbi:MAG: N-6 DNA methylase [Planctomycetes bacterium]|nr:N-6 DNA methylase [Planctomycetota bacterium]